ncbi:MAG: energy transducer TonB [Flavobacteriales bacterium]|nr:energy transducer TonB [Flavobacteriales bacterium]
MIARALLLLSFSCAFLCASAQFLEKAEFEGGVERAVTDGPRRQWNHPTYCRLVIDLKVSRAGKVLSAAVNVPLSSCSDTALVNKANALARTYVFTPNAQAPEPQAARFTWGIGERPQVEDLFGNDPVQMAPPPSMPEARETTVVRQHHSELTDPAGAERWRTMTAPEDLPTEDAPIFTRVEQMPQFPGGEEALLRYLNNTVQYPEMEAKAGIQGKVYVQFTVGKEGSISDVKVMRGVQNGPGLDREAVRAIQAMPKWSPGKMNGRPVSVRYTLPVIFMLP